MHHRWRWGRLLQSHRLGRENTPSLSSMPSCAEADADLTDLAVDSITSQHFRLVDQEDSVVIDVDFSLRQSHNQISGWRTAEWRLLVLFLLRTFRTSRAF